MDIEVFMQKKAAQTAHEEKQLHIIDALHIRANIFVALLQAQKINKL